MVLDEFIIALSIRSQRGMLLAARSILPHLFKQHVTGAVMKLVNGQLDCRCTAYTGNWGIRVGSQNILQ
jgi:hypothetical protein